MGIKAYITGAGKRPFIIEENFVIKPARLLRKLADFGYEKVQKISRQGEFRYLGDVLDIFPLASKEAFRIEFWGNQIETISPLDITPGEAFGEGLEERIAKSFIKNIEPGDYVVHLDHGIGRFQGNRTVKGEVYFLLQYAAGDKLFVPLSAQRKLRPYIGFGSPRLSRLEGRGWMHTKRRVSEDAAKLARELLFLYAKRSLVSRKPYREDGGLIKEFQSRFPFTFTNDQLTAIEDIRNDLSRSIPMDRLVCGDVGLGKTEVALHAMFQVASTGKQVILLTPTTILADQHFHYIKKRFSLFGIGVQLVSRMTDDTTLALTKTDVFIGTHKILSLLAKVPRLRLVVIDEEQKFGVKQKEAFKTLRANMDILSLSATPIPRTFQLALGGLRDISSILSPLPGKEPVLTYIYPFEKKLVQEAGAEELARNGQLYYLVPRIRDIAKASDLLTMFFPHARVAIAHGRLPERMLLKTIHEFRKKAFDILIATTIIENGLDLENVNTLIVQDAEKLGLAQAHQIRGRVGRRSVQAKAFFLYNPKKITEDGKKRLKFLRRFQGVGQNYELALKDLEIRGAGNVLGKEQSGSIRAVGLHLYMEILREAVKELQSKSKPKF